jgi:DNA repair photolyase
MNEKISKMLEPGALPPLERFELVKRLKEEGFLVGINAIPVLPYISDSEEELDKIFTAAVRSNADYILTGGLTLFGEGSADSKILYFRFLKKFDESLVSRYQLLYGNNFYTPFAYQNQLKAKAQALCKKYKISNSILASPR